MYWILWNSRSIIKRSGSGAGRNPIEQHNHRWDGTRRSPGIGPRYKQGATCGSQINGDRKSEHCGEIPSEGEAWLYTEGISRVGQSLVGLTILNKFTAFIATIGNRGYPGEILGDLSFLTL